MREHPRLRDLVDDVWCLTCSHSHIPDLPAVTFACASCGFGAWEVPISEDHATRYPEHVVYAIHHQTVPLAPSRPGPGKDEDGYPTVPDGWASVVMGVDTDAPADSPPVVLCGWTDDGYFHQYAPTEAIVTVCVEALQEAHRG